MVNLKNEPVAVGGAITGLVTAVLAALTAFGVWEPTPDQTAAIFGLLTALVAVVTTLVRHKTWGPQTVQDARLLPPCDVPPAQ